MTSSSSPSSSSSSSSSGRSVPRVHESTSGSPKIEVISSFSSDVPPEDMKAFVALEIMSYGLHAPSPGQHPYDPFPDGFGLSKDALEVGLRFPLHQVIEECLCRVGGGNRADSNTLPSVLSPMQGARRV
ncbi:unnamed protein product, partial [Musa acuminata subsp. burmannicoides]